MWHTRVNKLEGTVRTLSHDKVNKQVEQVRKNQTGDEKERQRKKTVNPKQAH